MSYVHDLGADAGPGDCRGTVRAWLVDAFWAGSNAPHHYEFMGGKAAVERMMTDAVLEALRAPTRAPFLAAVQTSKQRIVGARLSQGEEALLASLYGAGQSRFRVCQADAGSLFPVVAAAALWLAVRG